MREVIFKEDTHQYFDESGKEYPSVTTILKHFGCYNFGPVRQDIMDASSLFGNNFHELIRLYDEGNLGEYDPKLEPWLNGWKKMRAELKPDFFLIELDLVSEVWGIGGRPDRGFTIKTGPGVWDAKSGAEQPANAFQTAGYQLLIEENFPDFKLKERGSILVFENDYRIKQHKESTDLGIFKGLVNAYHWKKKKGLL